MSGIILLGLRIAAAVALYAFLGWTLLLMWRSLRQEAAFLSARKVAPLFLALEPADSSPKTLHFTSGEVAIGRDPDCECILADATISAHHARLSFHHNHWWLEDLGSRNGTSLNGELLTTATIIVNGDTIKCGQTTLQVILNDQSTRPVAGTDDMMEISK
jgi:pSer/pThr/pTyr-binding forkhead associated (FHA) protein